MEQSFLVTGESSKGIFVSNLSILAFLRYTLSELMTPWYSKNETFKL